MSVLGNERGGKLCGSTCLSKEWKGSWERVHSHAGLAVFEIASDEGLPGIQMQVLGFAVCKCACVCDLQLHILSVNHSRVSSYQAQQFCLKLYTCSNGPRLSPHLMCLPWLLSSLFLSGRLKIRKCCQNLYRKCC